MRSICLGSFESSNELCMGNGLIHKSLRVKRAILTDVISVWRKHRNRRRV